MIRLRPIVAVMLLLVLAFDRGRGAWAANPDRAAKALQLDFGAAAAERKEVREAVYQRPELPVVHRHARRAQRVRVLVPLIA